VDVDPVLEGLFAPMHLIIILAIALIVLGPKRLPETGRSLGAAIRGFKDSLTDADDADPRRAIQPARRRTGGAM
jgi:sec-independent protein translocase protein TatA